jgi:hypothetical protein
MAFVEFWNNTPVTGDLLGNITGSGPNFQTTWNTSQGNDGNFTLYARAYDRARNYLDSSPIWVVVDNNDPILTDITAPANETYIRGTITIYVNVADAPGGTGINSTEFWVGYPGGPLSQMLGTNYSQFEWDTTLYPGHLIILDIKISPRASM